MASYSPVIIYLLNLIAFNKQIVSSAVPNYQGGPDAPTSQSSHLFFEIINILVGVKLQRGVVIITTLDHAL